MDLSLMYHDEITKTKLCMKSLSVYRNILDDEVVKRLLELLEHLSLSGKNDELGKFLDLYNNFFFELSNSSPFISLKEYLVDRIIFSDNAFSRGSELSDVEAYESVFKTSAKNDLDYLCAVSKLSSAKVKSYIIGAYHLSGFERSIVENLPEWDEEITQNSQTSSFSKSYNYLRQQFLTSNNWSDNVDSLASFHKKFGVGMFARYTAFIWEYTGSFGRLRGVERPDPISLTELIDYEEERSEVISNTAHFLRGLPANNVLLYGDRGTGKSSTVKAILNEYHSQGLRMVEVPKKHLIDFPEIVRILKDRRQKFIIFVDDLTFEDNEENYTALKAVLEGGLECKPENVVIYATSNRRHLIKENFSDRTGINSGNGDDEIRAQDTIQEKLSLSDRFGITVVFSSPDKYKYLRIVEGIAAQRGLNVDKEYLHKEALKWELWYNGRSPRTARQFIDWLEGKEK
jgi:predicted AAA+ superfamily ATPase